MNKKILIRFMTIIILICLIMVVVFYQDDLLDNDKIELETKVITTQIIDYHDNNLIIRDNQNKTYTIDVSNNDAKDLYQYGNQVIIKYTGDINDKYTISNIKIEKNKIFNGELSKIQLLQVSSILSSMSIEDKIGQLLLVLNSNNLLKNQSVAGVVLYENDFEDKTRNEVINNIQEYQDNSNYPMLIAVDEEGGNLVRVSKYLRNNRFRLPQDVYEYGAMDSIVSDTTEKSEFLKEFGINVNLAPVCDVPVSESDYIYSRSFGLDANATSKYVQNVISITNEMKIGNVLKHFPGYGNAPESSGTYHDNREYKEFEERDLKPFIAGIEAGSNAILVTNNIIDCLDNQNPATLSKKVHNLLREDLNYHGVILTDDISGINQEEFGSVGEIAIKAIQAGNDLIMTDDPQSCFDAILEAVNNGNISLNQLDNSLSRVIAWKISLELFEN